MGERADGLDPALGSAWTPAPGIPDPGVPVLAAGDIDREESGDETQNDPEILQARAEIEETRAEMSETIDALKERLSPQRLAEEARESVREATIGRAEEAVHNAAESARDMWHEAGTTAKGAGNRMFETIKENPLPAALIGIGAGWLLVSARQHDSGMARYEGTVDAYPRPSDYYSASGAYKGPPTYGSSASTGGGSDMADRAREGVETVKEKASQTAERLQESAGYLSEQARERARSVRYSMQEQVHQNPLGVGLAAMALGVAVGFALPETRQENRLMGEARENVVERVGETAQELAQKVQSVAQEAVSSASETAQQAARDQGLTPQ